jgi:hypothetical protein
MLVFRNTNIVVLVRSMIHRNQMQDAMAIVRVLGTPDLFITVTCNPLWPEITSCLYHGQQASDRPELITRVFKMRLDFLLHLIKHVGVFTKNSRHPMRPVGNVHVIEFQKRGLPHAHLLIILANEDKLRTTRDYDDVVSAEIPEPVSICKMDYTHFVVIYIARI